MKNIFTYIRHDKHLKVSSSGNIKNAQCEAAGNCRKKGMQTPGEGEYKIEITRAISAQLIVGSSDSNHL